jgi:hypothetical protein
MIAKCLLAIAVFVNACIPTSDAFVAPLRLRTYAPKHIQLCMKHNKHNKHNTSKIFRMDFSEDQEEDELQKFMEPRYALGLSEYHMTLLRIYVYMVITMHVITQVIMKK